MRNFITSPISARLLFRILIGVTFTGFISAPVFAATYLFTAPPRETVEQGQVLYGSLADHLSKLLKTPVAYHHSKTWPEYKNSVQSGKYDLFFDGPQFAAWRIENKQALPLVKLTGKLEYTLVGKSSNPALVNARDFVGRKICSSPSPNLGTLSLYALYPNPMQQPKFVAVNGGFEKIVAAFNAGRCDGALFNSPYLNEMSAKTRNKMKVITRTSVPINQGITVSTRIDANLRRQLQHFFTSREGSLAAKALIERFSNGKSKFIEAKESDYAGQNLLQHNMIFGW